MQVVEWEGWRGRHRLGHAELAAEGRWMREAVLGGDIVLIRGFFPPDLVRAARAFCGDWRLSQPAGEGDIRPGGGNFHRIDDAEAMEKIVIKRRLHRFFFLPWNAREGCPADEMGLGAVKLRNAVMGFPEDRFLAGPDAGHFTHWTILHYPRGGGYLAPHADPIEPALAELGIPLSRFGEDFKRGGFWVQAPAGGRIALEERLVPGDVALFRQDFLHGVDPIDSEAPFDWNDGLGRWGMIVPVRQGSAPSRY